jgi:hypothetical protein
VARGGGDPRGVRPERGHPGPRGPAGRARLPGAGARPARRQALAALHPQHVPAAAGRVGSGLRSPGRVPRLAGRAPRLHRQDRGDRLLHGRRLRAAVRATRGVLRRGGQLRRGPRRRRSGAGRLVPGHRELWRPGLDGRLASAAARGRADHAGGAARRQDLPRGRAQLHEPEAGRDGAAHQAGAAAVRQGRGRGRLAADLRVLRHAPAGFTGPGWPSGPGRSG